MQNRKDMLTRIFLALGFLGFGAMVQAVSPAPDGGYAGFNTAEGTNALFNLTTANDNTALGGQALFHDTTGSRNTAVGLNALFFNVIGSNNTATGAQTLQSNTANGNTANGQLALFGNTTGSQNTAVGFGALYYNTRGNNNIALGINAGNGVTTADNVICIGANGNNVDNSCYIGHIFNATSSGGTAVYVNMNGRLGTATSSRRFKEGIKPMGDASETLFLLNPVSFRYKKEVDPEAPQGKSQLGLVAEDIEKVNPDLVVRDKEGKPYSVRYDQVNATLLNEFLKEHRKVEKLEATLAQQQKEMQLLSAHLKEQDLKIQKVSAQVEISRAGPGVVTNDPQNLKSNTSSQ